MVTKALTVDITVWIQLTCTRPQWISMKGTPALIKQTNGQGKEACAKSLPPDSSFEKKTQFKKKIRGYLCGLRVRQVVGRAGADMVGSCGPQASNQLIVEVKVHTSSRLHTGNGYTLFQTFCMLLERLEVSLLD